MWKTAEDFIKQHSYINYCEAIINKEGLIQYAVPSHIEALIRATGKSSDEIYNEMPIYASPILWLVDYSGFISVWSCGHCKPEKCTKEQIITLRKLIDNKLVEDSKLFR